MWTRTHVLQLDFIVIKPFTFGYIIFTECSVSHAQYNFELIVLWGRGNNFGSY